MAAVNKTHALIVIVSRAFNAVTNMEPIPGIEKTDSTIALPAIINPKLWASIVTKGGRANRLTIKAILRSETPRERAYNTKSWLYPSKSEERNTRILPAATGIARAKAGRIKSFRLSAPHNAENRNLNRKGQQEHKTDPVVGQRHGNDPEQVNCLIKQPAFLTGSQHTQGNAEYDRKQQRQ